MVHLLHLIEPGGHAVKPADILTCHVIPQGEEAHCKDRVTATGGREYVEECSRQMLESWKL